MSAQYNWADFDIGQLTLISTGRLSLCATTEPLSKKPGPYGTEEERFFMLITPASKRVILLWNSY